MGQRTRRLGTRRLPWTDLRNLLERELDRVRIREIKAAKLAAHLLERSRRGVAGWLALALALALLARGFCCCLLFYLSRSGLVRCAVPESMSSNTSLFFRSILTSVVSSSHDQ